ncbi:uncharacterized protein LOC106459453 [Limulus polyphemus]|uniref:Uncharacterized protein LOC106459453 n=1 Tax=Limulus polyphemus TaxID=6850 RepID=A0ABM1B4B0_LIMPO|nr:uncharacterized protein LOC106459453 [Limulus polyphemus]
MDLQRTLLDVDRILPLNNSKKETDETSTPKNVRRIIRLKRPLGRSLGNKRIIVTKRLLSKIPSQNAVSLQTRKPSFGRDVNNEESSNVLEVESFHNFFYSTALPLTFYTTFTYFTTFLQGTIPLYTSREAVRSSIILQTPSPDIVSIIQSHSGYKTVLGDKKITPLGSRSREGTTTIVNLGSRVQVFNNDIQRAVFATPSAQTFDEMQTVNLNYLDSITKTYYTYFTYYYTFYNSFETQKSTRSEITSSTLVPGEKFLKYSFVNTIDSNGFLTVDPTNRVVNLGSTDIDGTTTQIQLALQTRLKLNGIQNAVLETDLLIATPEPSKTTSTILPSNNVNDVIGSSKHDYSSFDRAQLQASYFSVEDSSFSNHHSPVLDATPKIPSTEQADVTALADKPKVRVVTSIIRRPSGSLRSRTFSQRPGVRIRVKPVTSKARTTTDFTGSAQPSTLTYLDSRLSSSLSFSTNVLVSSSENILANAELDENLVSDIEQTSPNIVPTPTLTSSLDNSIESIPTLITSETETTSMSRKRLKITVRRPITGIQSSRTTTRFVLPSRLDVTRRPKYYVVTRTNPLGIVHPSVGPYGIKVSRRFRPSVIKEPILRTGVDGYTDSSSLPQTVKPTEAVVLTFFTTTTFTVPYTVGDQTLYTTVEQTNSRIVTQPVGQSFKFEVTPSLSYSTVSRQSVSFVDNLLSSSAYPKISSSLSTELTSSSFVKLDSLSSFLISSGTENTIPTFTPEELIELQRSVKNALKAPSQSPTTTISDDQTLLITGGLDGLPTTQFYDPSSTPSALAEAVETVNAILTESPVVDKVAHNLETQYTTFTLYTTLFSGSSTITSSFEKVVSNVITPSASGELTSFLTSPSFNTQVSKKELISEKFSKLVETSEVLKTSTVFSTSTFFATLFNGTSSFVSPIEDVHSEVYTITELTTFTRTLGSTSLPSISASIATKSSKPVIPTPVYSTVTEYTTYTNFLTLFQEDSSIISSIEEVDSNVYTITLHGSITELSTANPATSHNSTQPIPISSILAPSFSSFLPSTSTFSSSEDSYLLPAVIFSPAAENTLKKSSTVLPASIPSSSPTTIDIPDTSTLVSSTSETTEEPEIVITRTTTQTIYSTNTHYVTLFSGTQTILSSIEDVQSKLLATTVTETIRGSITLNPVITSTINKITSRTTTSVASKTIPTELLEISYPKLVPSLQTYLTTYTYFTTLKSGTNTIVSSKEEIATSYITLFVPESSLIESSELNADSITKPYVSYRTTTEYSTYTFFTTLFDGEDQVTITNEQVIPQVKTSTITVSPADFSSITPMTSSESVLTFYSTYTYYTTFVTGTKTTISSSLSSVTQFVTMHPATSKEKTGSSSLLVEPSLPVTIDAVSTITDSLETAVILTKATTSTPSTTSAENFGTTFSSSNPTSLVVSSETAENSPSMVSLKESTSLITSSSELEDIVSIVTIVSTAVSTEEATSEVINASSTEEETSSVHVETRISVQTSVSVDSNVASHLDSSVATKVETVTKLESSSVAIADEKQSVTPTFKNADVLLISSIKPSETEELNKSIISPVPIEESPVVEIKKIITTTEKSSDTLSFNSGTSTKIIGGSTVVFFTDFILPGLEQPSLKLSATPSITVVSEDNDYNISLGPSTFVIPPSFIDQETDLVSPAGNISENTSEMVVIESSGYVENVNELYLSSAILDDLRMHSKTSTEEEDDIQSGSVIDLSDLLGGNANIAGNLAEAVKGILHKINIKGGDANETTENISSLGYDESKTETSIRPSESETTENIPSLGYDESKTETSIRPSESETTENIPSLGYDESKTETSIRPSDSETTENIPSLEHDESKTETSIRPSDSETTENISSLEHEESKMESSTKPISTVKTINPTGILLGTFTNENINPNLKSQSSDLSSYEQKSYDSQETQIFTGIKTIFFDPTAVFEKTTKPTVSLDPSNSESRNEDMLKSQESVRTVPGRISSKIATPEIEAGISTSVITGFKTVFIETSMRDIEDKNPSQKEIQAESTAPLDMLDQVSKKIQALDKTTILGSSSTPLPLDSESSRNDSTPTSNGQIIITKTSTGAKTIFFPFFDKDSQAPMLPEEEDNSSADYTPTRYVTSLESSTRTLILTTTKIYYTRDSPLTITSVFTTTIPPRTFVSTLIGSKTILGTLLEPTESVKFEKSTLASESTTKVTTTTLIFNSITTTVVRTLVLRTEDLIPSTTSTLTSTTAVVNVSKEDTGTKTFSTDSTTSNLKGSISTTARSFEAFTEREEQFKSISRQPKILTKPENLLVNLTTELTGLVPTLRHPSNPLITSDASSPSTKLATLDRKGSKEESAQEYCIPQCDRTKKEQCKKIEDTWSCECGPGFARTETSMKCEEVNSYVVLLRLAKMKDSALTYRNELSNTASPVFQKLAKLAKKGVSQAYKDSRINQSYVNVDVNSISNIKKLNMSNHMDEGVLVNFTVRVKRNSLTDEKLLKEELSRSIAASNYSVGNTELYVSPLVQSVENVQDFDECSEGYNDCATTASCINQPGTFTCQCKKGYEDLDSDLPGRICLGEIKGCDYCNGRGDCIMADGGARICSCHRMYFGRRCEVNGLVLAIVLPVAVILLVLLSCCLLYCCRCWRHQRHKKAEKKAMIRAMGMNNGSPVEGIVDKKAMILDSSSDISVDHGIRHPYSFDGPYQLEDSTLPKKSSGKSELSLDRSLSTGFAVSPMVIPRAKHHAQHLPKQLNYGVYQGQLYAW